MLEVTTFDHQYSIACTFRYVEKVCNSEVNVASYAVTFFAEKWRRNE